MMNKEIAVLIKINTQDETIEIQMDPDNRLDQSDQSALFSKLFINSASKCGFGLDDMLKVIQSVYYMTAGDRNDD